MSVVSEKGDQAGTELAWGEWTHPCSFSSHSEDAENTWRNFVGAEERNSTAGATGERKKPRFLYITSPHSLPMTWNTWVRGFIAAEGGKEGIVATLVRVKQVYLWSLITFWGRGLPLLFQPQETWWRWQSGGEFDKTITTQLCCS